MRDPGLSLHLQAKERGSHRTQHRAHTSGFHFGGHWALRLTPPGLSLGHS